MVDGAVARRPSPRPSGPWRPASWTVAPPSPRSPSAREIALATGRSHVQRAISPGVVGAGSSSPPAYNDSPPTGVYLRKSDTRTLADEQEATPWRLGSRHWTRLSVPEGPVSYTH